MKKETHMKLPPLRVPMYVNENHKARLLHLRVIKQMDRLLPHLYEGGENYGLIKRCEDSHRKHYEYFTNWENGIYQSSLNEIPLSYKTKCGCYFCKEIIGTEETN